MERLGDSFLKELLRVAGANVEELGNILKTKNEFTDEELRDIQTALRQASDSIKMIREHSTAKL